MLISTKGRYALNVMLDLARNSTGEHIVLMDVAERTGISEKYLESILAALSREGLLSAQRGRGGGYLLTRTPEEYFVGDIIRAAEGDLAPVACLKTGDVECPKAAECITLPLWRGLDRRIYEYLDGITLRDVLDGRIEDESLPEKG